jgi:hypothetical protein
MQKNILDHYLEFSLYTNPGLYRDLLLKLPDDIRELGLLVRKNIIHRTTLAAGNIGTNADLRFGDMTKVPWWRQPEDDVLTTAPAMLAELYRRDKRGFVADRKPENKIVVTCRFVAILMATILKTKGIPTRVRSGHAAYFDMHELGKVSTDHWINQYWNYNEKRWITIDVDGSLSLNESFDPYDIPDEKFDFPARSWIDIRAKNVDPNHFVNGSGDKGAMTVAWALFYDFHSLMNDEIIYLHMPEHGTFKKFPMLKPEELNEVDKLAELMLDPDKNFDELQTIWNTKKKFRLLNGGLL